MRKRRFTKTIGLLISTEMFDQLVRVSDKEEISMAKFIRMSIEGMLKEYDKSEK